MKLLDAALGYAARGWKVFPIRPALKIPATPNGFKDATADADKITNWWTARMAFADRNIGVCTSRASGIWVLDCDVDKETGELGEGTLDALMAEHGELPPCPIQMTPTGGKHYVFAWPDDGEDLPRRIKFKPGLDALGSRMDGEEEIAGYFIVAPSVRQDGEYKWIVPPDMFAPPQAPAWLVQMIREARTERPADLPRIAPVIGASTTPYGRKALLDLCSEIAAAMPGTQNSTLMAKATRIGSIAAGGNIDWQEAYTSAVDAGMRMVNQAGEDPWTQKLVEKKVREAMDYGAKDPTMVRPRERAPEPEPQKPVVQLVVSNPEKPKKEKKPKPDRYIPDWQIDLDFVLNEEGTIKASSLRNLQTFMKHHPDLKNRYWYDEFADEIFIGSPLPGEAPIGEYPRPIQDYDETCLAAWLNGHGLAPSISGAAAALREQAFANKRNPFLDWSSALKWDGKPRVDMWLSYYAGAEDTEYTRLVGRKFLISAMARGMEPGCKVDTMLILEGQQGLKKSSLVRELAGASWFSDQVGDVTNKDSSQLLQGIWIMEIPEMDKFSRAEANAVKDFLTRRFDRYRPPYGRNVIKRERRVVFFGTINPDGVGYLKDTTGNRRYWPVTVTSIDLEGVAADRDQLWAEALTAYRAGEKWWIDEDQASLVAPEQEARRDDDVWEPRIKRWLDDPERRMSKPFFTSDDALTMAIGLDAKMQKHSDKIRVAKILKLLGCKDHVHKNGIHGRSWEYLTA